MNFTSFAYECKNVRRTQHTKAIAIKENKKDIKDDIDIQSIVVSKGERERESSNGTGRGKNNDCVDYAAISLCHGLVQFHLWVVEPRTGVSR